MQSLVLALNNIDLLGSLGAEFRENPQGDVLVEPFGIANIKDLLENKNIQAPDIALEKKVLVDNIYEVDGINVNQLEGWN